MKIVSQTKDYYDYLAALSQDTETVFNRPRETRLDCDGFPITDGKGMASFKLDRSEFSTGHNLLLINFCGKIYKGIIKHKIISNTLSNCLIDQIAWEEAAHALLKTDYDHHNYNEKKHKEFLCDWPKIPIAAKIRASMRWNTGRNDEYIFQYPLLKTIGFGRIVRPEDAYNEIYKYLCTNGRPEPVIPQMTNDIKIEQAGFDVKQSFRKVPRT